MQRQAIVRMTPVVRAVTGASRRTFIGVHNKSKVVENQAYFQRQGTLAQGQAPTFLRKESKDKAVLGVWAGITTVTTLIGVKMIYDMTWGENKREGM